MYCVFCLASENGDKQVSSFDLCIFLFCLQGLGRFSRLFVFLLLSLGIAKECKRSEVWSLQCFGEDWNLFGACMTMYPWNASFTWNIIDKIKLKLPDSVDACIYFAQSWENRSAFYLIYLQTAWTKNSPLPPQQPNKQDLCPHTPSPDSDIHCGTLLTSMAPSMMERVRSTCTGGRARQRSC